ncbi:MAG: DUF3488 and transglutaminase-like domain-containing protein [Phycisphaerales bacterium]|nr:DUF3488 and transglutaminase-like domain-containing protein [Phycisphaerales bacterium]
MKSERFFRLTVLLTALAGHLAYAFAAEKPGLALVGVLAIALSGWLVSQSLKGQPRPLPRALLNGLVVAAIAHLTLQLLGRTQEVITSLTDFLAYVMLVKSFDRARMRDEAQLLGLSLFVVIGALLTGQSLAMGLALLAYTPLAITSTVLLQMYHSIERHTDTLRAVGLADQVALFGLQLERQRAPRASLAVASVCVIASVASGVVAFIVTPRQLAQQLGMATAPFVKTQATGFTDSIKLGSAGNIYQDNTPVMDVRVITGAGVPGELSRSGGPIYLRGAVLSSYQKGTWTGLEHRSAQADPPEPNPFDKRQSGSLIVPGGERARIRTRYEIIQRNAKATAGESPLFAPLHPVSVSTDAKGQIVYRAADGMLKLIPGPGGRLAYSVTSASDYLEPDAGGAEPPTNTFSPRVQALARSILSEHDVDPTKFKESPTEIRRAAQAVTAYLASYPYTLEMIAPQPGQDPIEMFLFETKTGHCEYFSAAMVALLSSSGIPARVATGFAAAEFNSVSGYYTVRQSDAHAWVEVRMSPDRWETFDPTPAGELQSSRRASAGPIGWLKHLWDAIEFSWLDNVVAYDKGIKLDVIGLAGRNDPGAAAVKWQNNLATVQTWVRKHLPESVIARSLLVGALTFVLVMSAYWLFRIGAMAFAPLRALLARLTPRRARATPGETAIPTDARFYREALDELDAAGRAKPAAMPPITFSATLDPGAATALQHIARLFYQSRFGGAPLSPELQAIGRAALADLRAALTETARPRT